MKLILVHAENFCSMHPGCRFPGGDLCRFVERSFLFSQFSSISTFRRITSCFSRIRLELSLELTRLKMSGYLNSSAFIWQLSRSPHVEQITIEASKSLCCHTRSVFRANKELLASLVASQLDCGFLIWQPSKLPNESH